MPGISVKDVPAAAEKYKARGQAATPDYVAGIRGSGQRWQQNASASEEAYQQGVQEAIGRNAFSKGIAGSGAAYFEQRATSLGAQRFGPGVAAGASNWADGFQPYADRLKAITLSPRGPKGDPRNMTRAQEVATALRAAKIAR